LAFTTLLSGSMAVLAQSSPQAGLLEHAGWTALEAGQLAAAGEAFHKAAAADPKNVRAHLGVALVAFVERRDEAAMTAVNRVLALAPADRRARELRGRLLYRGGDLHAAIGVFDTLVREASDDGLTETLDRWRREAELGDRMNLAVGNGFTVAFDGPSDDALAARVLEIVERAAARIDDRLSYIRTAPVAIVLYTNEQFRDITRSPPWAAGAFDGRIRVPIRGAREQAEDLERVLAHEYVHSIVFALARRRVPAWFNEGLAAALESDRAQASDRAPDVPPAPPRLGALDRSFQNLSGRDARAAYDFSASAVQTLLDEAGGFTIVTLLADVGDGVPFEQAFAYRIGRTVAEFEQRLRGEPPPQEWSGR
jgi:tetratricopeptide (TPR) repeat protein